MPAVSRLHAHLTSEQKAFKKLPFSTQVVLAQPLAIERMLKSGLEAQGDVVRELETLVGPPPLDVDPQTRWFAYVDHTNAAFALGISLGLLLPSDFFRRPL